MNDEELTREIIAELSAYLLAEMASITSADQIVEEWPESNDEMAEYPVISIMTPGAPNYEPYMGVNKPFESAENDPGKTYDYKYAVGQYDFELQIDIWTDYKEKRHLIYQEFFAAFHKKLADQGHSGVNLTLTNYHGAPVNYQMVGYNYGDSEEASQRKEWRVKIDVIANCEAVIETTQAAMVDNQAVTTIDDSSKIE